MRKGRRARAKRVRTLVLRLGDKLALYIAVSLSAFPLLASLSYNSHERGSSASTAEDTFVLGHGRSGAWKRVSQMLLMRIG